MKPNNHTVNNKPDNTGRDDSTGRDNTGRSEEEKENTDDTLTVANEDTAKPVPETRTTQDVRQGHTGDHVRYILMISFTTIVVVFLLVYLFFMR